MHLFNATTGHFHVYVTKLVPFGSGCTPHVEKATALPVDWQRACQWVKGIMLLIANDECRYVDCHIEPASGKSFEQIKADIEA